MEFNCNNCGRKNIKPEYIKYKDLIREGCKTCVRNANEPNCSPSMWIGEAYVTEESTDMVNHPDHYNTELGLETIDVIEAFTHGLDGIEAVCTGNVIKYICRWKKKNGIEDLKKAEWYLQKLIRHMELVESKNKLEEKEII